MATIKTIFDPMSASLQTVLDFHIGQVVSVGVSGADYSSIQDAIDAIIDATSIKQYVVQIGPGVYAENITLKPFVHLYGLSNGPAAPTITGTMAALFTTPGELCVLNKIGVNRTVGSDGEVICDFEGAVFMNDFFCIGVTANDYGFTCVKTNNTTEQGTAVSGYIAAFSTYDGSSKDITAFELLGDKRFAMTQMTFAINALASIGTLTARKVSSTSSLTSISNAMIITNPKAGYAGTCIGTGVYSASTEERLFFTEQSSVTGLGGGFSTANMFLLNSSGGSAKIKIAASSFYTNGIGTTYSCDTASGDTVEGWNISMNIDMEKTGAGLATILEHDLLQTGFISWSTVGATYWSYDTGTAEFTVDKRGTGIIHGSPITWVTGQSVTIVDRAVNYVYMDFNGTIGVTQARTDALFENSVVLFEVWREGTNYIVSKENHPVNFNTAASNAWHDLFGSLLESASQTLAINSGANRTVDLVGTNVINDHGVETAVSAQTPVSWRQIVEGVSGKIAQIASATGIVSNKSDGTDTGVAVANGRYIVYRLGVVKDSINSSSPTFICQADDADSGNASAAATRITSGIVRPFASELKMLEICQLGFAVIRANGAGAGTLTSVVTALQVFGAAFVSGGTSSSATLISTNVTNFGKVLSGTDLNVQTALDTIDDNAMKIPFSSPFDATTSWGAAAGGYYTITITAATHGRGTNPIARCLSGAASPYTVIYPLMTKTTAGDIAIKVPDLDSGDYRFAGILNIFG